MTSDRVVLKKGYKPKKSEKYMGPEQQEYFRRKLLEWRGELLDESTETIRNTGSSALGSARSASKNSAPSGTAAR